MRGASQRKQLMHIILVMKSLLISEKQRFLSVNFICFLSYRTNATSILKFRQRQYEKWILGFIESALMNIIEKPKIWTAKGKNA